MQQHRILFIDAYDSFSNSIIALLESELPVTVESIKIDDDRFVLNDEAFHRHLDGFDAVVAGPGPGHPQNSSDVGLIGKLWSLPLPHVLPILGICLGFQSLCLAQGARVERLREPRHGIVTVVSHRNEDIFSDAGQITATQYHSLHVKLHSQQENLCLTQAFWESAVDCERLLPLAWDLTSPHNGPVLMAVRHASKPFWGVQYHPESICTNKEGQKLLRRWWQEVCSWHSRDLDSSMKIHLCAMPEQRSQHSDRHDVLRPSPNIGLSPFHRQDVSWTSVPMNARVEVTQVFNMLRGEGVYEPLILESGTRMGKPVNQETGRWTIIGLPDDCSLQIRYSTGSHSLEVSKNGSVVHSRHSTARETFDFVDQTMKANKVGTGPSDVPFWGGMIGYVSYEAGLETINVAPSLDRRHRPDIWFIFTERSILVDHIAGVAYIQTIRGNDRTWINDMRSRVVTALTTTPGHLKNDQQGKIPGLLKSQPRKTEYCEKVSSCKSLIRAGESYELCLTDQTSITSSVHPWKLYCHLRKRNPAPFSSYLRFAADDQAGLVVASSSPERFVSWSRNGHCQFRPIKGTVKKSPRVTRLEAEELLGSAKERAENLMIVDLIRHDLSGVSGNVRVPQLMSIEEYETVFQLVSVIEGDLDASTSGIAALTASLPPGSMTGAPKKRSCELLKEIESGQPRGLYSGVIGYLDVGGGGDFSVVIRTAFKWDDDEEWRVGAGGAITALSNAEEEWQEMLTKRESVLDCFEF